MRYFLCFCIVCRIFCACGNHEGDQKSVTKPPDTPTTAVITDTPGTSGTSSDVKSKSASNDASAGADTVLWVGKPARYIKRPDYILDGKFDAQQSIFIACGSEQPERIANASMIAYDDVSNCDTSFRNTIRYIMKPLNINLPPQLTQITVAQDPRELTSHVPISVTNGKTAVMIKPADEIRIRAAAATHLNEVMRRKMLIPVKK